MKLNRIISLLKNLDANNAGLYYSKTKRNLTSRFKSAYFKRGKKNFKPEEAFVLFSEARGGSTWMMEVLQKNLNSISIFEPIWWGEGCSFRRDCKGFNYSSPFYFSDQGSREALFAYLKKVLSGTRSGKRMIQFNTFSQLHRGDTIIVKFVNVNLIAPWFTRKFQMHRKPVYILRHPLAILASRENYGNIGDVTKENQFVGKYNRDRLKSESHPYYSHLKELDNADNKYCRYVAEWCIRNSDFLKGKYDNQFHIVYYEDMVLNSKGVLEKLANEWNIEIKNYRTDGESGTTSIGGGVNKGQKQLSKWLDFFSDKEKNEMQLILDQFRIDTYSAHSPNVQVR